VEYKAKSLEITTELEHLLLEDVKRKVAEFYKNPQLFVIMNMQDPEKNRK
jgi:hypothetical protein